MTIDAVPAVPTGITPDLEVVLERFRLLARCRAAWLQELWSLEEAATAGVVTRGEMTSALEDRDSPAAEHEWLTTSAEARAWNQRLTELAGSEVLQKGRLARFAQIFGLTREEQDLFEGSLAVSLDPSLGRVCAFLQDHAGHAYMTEPLASRLYRHGRVGPWQAESALFRWELIARRDAGAGDPAILICDPQVRDWLCGREGLDDVLASAARLCAPREPLRSWPVERTLRFLKPLLAAHPPERARIVVCGPSGSGRRTFSAVVAAQLGFPLLVVNADAVEDAGWPRLVLRTMRHAFLERCAPAFIGESLSRRPWPIVPTSFPLEFLILRAGQEIPPAKPGCVEQRLDMPMLSVKERLQLWHTCLPESRAWPRQQFRTLVARQRTTVGEIAAVARVRVAGPVEAGRLLRRASRSRFGNLAQRLECPFASSDLVVDAPLREALDDFMFEARVRGRFWERRSARQLFPQGRGLLALFSGPPGTGKTMAAQVIARELGLDLFRVDLANVISKWVGETAKNLDDVVRRAAETDAVLLFDECDAAFARRTTEIRDAQDRFANTDTAHLLQAIEGFPGIALLATNQKTHIDPAFVRRLRYVLEFPRPLAPQRLELWRKLVSGLAGEERAAALERTLEVLANTVEITGAQIKLSVLTAVFAARRDGQPVGPRHFVKGLDRELSKESRALGARERERILSSGE